jgi:hypothetical protein
MPRQLTSRYGLAQSPHTRALIRALYIVYLCVVFVTLPPAVPERVVFAKCILALDAIFIGRSPMSQESWEVWWEANVRISERNEMLRRVAIVTFASAMLLVVACGRQITPNPSTSNLAGHIDLRFRVSGPFNYAKYDYQIVIDACGQGVPLPNPGTTSSVKNYTYSFNIGTSPYSVAQQPYPTLIQYALTTGLSGLTPLPLPALSPADVSFTPDSNGSGTEFELIFDRGLLNNPKTLPQPCPGFTEPPTTTSALRPNAGAGASPLVGAAGLMAVAGAATTSPVPTASTTPLPTATVASQSTWIINFIVLTPNEVPVDSLGQGGPSDNTYSGIIVPTDMATQIPVVKLTDISGAPSDPAASITGGEVDNYP